MYSTAFTPALHFVCGTTHFHLGFTMRDQYWHNTWLVALPRVIWNIKASVQYNTHDDSLIFLKYVE